MNYETKIEIKDAMGAVEDAAGALTTVKTVLAAACEQVEHIQSLATAITAPTADALRGTADMAWGLVTQAEAALADNLTILYAASDQRDRQPFRSLSIVQQREWSGTLLAYQQATAAVEEAKPETIESATRALNNLLHCRAPTYAALLEKLRIIEAEGYQGSPLTWSSIANDVRVLGGEIEE